MAKYICVQKLVAVCKSWKSVVNDPQFHEDRKWLGRCEDAIALIEMRSEAEGGRFRGLIYYLEEDKWESHPFIPTQFQLKYGMYSHCVFCNQQLIVTKLFNSLDNAATNVVLRYDFHSGRWKRGANMPDCESFYIYSLYPQGKICTAGGGNILPDWWLQYNVEEDEWEALSSAELEEMELKPAPSFQSRFISEGGGIWLLFTCAVHPCLSQLLQRCNHTRS